MLDVRHGVACWFHRGNACMQLADEVSRLEFRSIIAPMPSLLSIRAGHLGSNEDFDFNFTSLTLGTHSLLHFSSMRADRTMGMGLQRAHPTFLFSLTRTSVERGMDVRSRHSSRPGRLFCGGPTSRRPDVTQKENHTPALARHKSHRW